MKETWWKNAVIYAVDVERFCDGNGDGIGDFQGLRSKLPYLADLGITCLWLLPFYASAERDNGYDVDDYLAIRPALGNLADFAACVHEAGELGIRILLDMVVDHTSNRHPWFEAARRSRSSRFRNYYYWSEQPPAPEPGQENILPGEENGVWTWDDQAQAYYHHRFYHFMPSLNVHNPLVRAEIRRIMDFWMAFGIAGFRLDAAGHMAEHPGHEDEPEDAQKTLQQIFRHLRTIRSDSVLLGEVDVPPEKLGSFFARKQMNMMFSFLLNNYLALALATQKAEPMSRAFALLPKSPVDAQWVNFLRNFDDWDLEQLEDSDRQQVFKAFAPKEDMRIFGRGIRRRLASMLGGNQRRIEMAWSLLFSLPGTPTFFYGEEIGMGEDLSQEGRASVRAPMQWSAKRNGGFSTVQKPSLLPQPMIASGVFGYQQVNVEEQSKREDSLLAFFKRLIKLWRSVPAIGTADFSCLPVNRPQVLAHEYCEGKDAWLMLHNLSGKVAIATISVDEEQHGEYEDMWSGSRHRAAEEGLALRLEPYAYFWLQRVQPEAIE